MLAGTVPEALTLQLTTADARLGAGIALQALVPMFEMLMLVLWLIKLLALEIPLLAPPGVLMGEQSSLELF